MVISNSHNNWVVSDAENNVYACFDKICTYKYLGIVTHNTTYKTAIAKQIKTVMAARKYRGACRYLSRRGPDVVDVACCSWNNVAIPALLFGSESIAFSETNIEKLEREQARWAKETLRLPQSCSNLAAQLLMGAPPVRVLLYKQQLKFYMRLNKLPVTRFAAQALREHESGGWRSPYLAYIHDIQIKVNMLQLPPSIKCLEVVMDQYGEDWLEDRARKVSNLSAAALQLGTGRVRSTREGEGWGWINRAIMGASGIRLCRRTGVWTPVCSQDAVANTDLHCVSSCSKTRRARRDTGVSQYFASCHLKGLGEEAAYTNFILGLDWKGAEVPMEDYQERGVSLGEIFKAAKI